MKQITMYEAIDGERFVDERMCVEHEQWLEDLAAGNELLTSGASLWDALVRAHARCGFDWPTASESQKATLSTITKNTKLAIRHWQCREEPGYSPRNITTDGHVFVHGDAGSWSGPYGSDVPVRDLVRYAEDTALSEAKP